MCGLVCSSYKIVAISSGRFARASRVLKSFKGLSRRSGSVRASGSESSIKRSRKSFYSIKRKKVADVKSLPDFLDRFSVPEDLTLDSITFKLDRKTAPIRLCDINWSENLSRLESLKLMLHINHAVKNLFKGQDHQYERYQLSLDEVHRMPYFVEDLFREKSYLNMLAEIKDKGLFSIYVNKVSGKKAFLSKPRAAAKSRFEKMARSKRFKRSNTVIQPERSVSPCLTLSEKFELKKLEEFFPEFVREYNYKEATFQYLNFFEKYAELQALSSPSSFEKQQLEKCRELEITFIDSKQKYQDTLDYVLPDINPAHLKASYAAFKSIENEVRFVLKTSAYHDLHLHDSQYSLLKDCLVINRALTTDRYKLTLNEADFYSKMYSEHFSVKHYLDLITTIESRFHLFELYCKGFEKFKEAGSTASDYRATIAALGQYATKTSLGPEPVSAWTTSADLELVKPTPLKPSLSPAHSLKSIHSEEGIQPVSAWTTSADLELIKPTPVNPGLSPAPSLVSIHSGQSTSTEDEYHTPKKLDTNTLRTHF